MKGRLPTSKMSIFSGLVVSLLCVKGRDGKGMEAGVACESNANTPTDSNGDFLC